MCHQTVSLIARHLEANGIPTVIMGCARDIVEHAGVPRFYFSNFPLGHSAGKPFDQQSQQHTLRGALALFDDASAPRTTVVSPQLWAADDSWEKDFWNIDALDAQTLAKLKQDHERVREVAANIKASS